MLLYWCFCHGLSVSLSCFGVFPVLLWCLCLVSPHVRSSFPPVWSLLPPLMCFSCYSLRALTCLCSIFKPLSFLCSLSDHCSSWWVVSCVLPVFPLLPVLPASPVLSVFLAFCVNKLSFYWTVCYWVLPACLPPANHDNHNSTCPVSSTICWLDGIVTSLFT